MAVELVTTTQRFVGLSSDGKPAAPPAGSEFFETDTFATYVFAGGAWVLRPDRGGVLLARKTLVFDGTAGKGAIGAVPLFTVSGGAVLLERVVPRCVADVTVDGGTGNASLELGVVGATTLLVASTLATDLDADEVWTAAAPAAKAVALPAALKDVATTVNVQANVTSTGTQKINGGTLEVSIYWRRLSASGLIVPV